MTQSFRSIGKFCSADGPLASVVLRWGYWIFGAYIFVGIALSVWIQTEFNAAYYWAFKMLPIPFGLCFLIVVWFWRKHLLFGSRLRWKRISEIVCAYPVLVLVSGGYVAAVNAWIPPQVKVSLTGSITRISELGDAGRSPGISRIVDVQLDEGRVFEMPSDEAIDARFKVGDRVRIDMTKGSLGIYYFYRW